MWNGGSKNNIEEIAAFIILVKRLDTCCRCGLLVERCGVVVSRLSFRSGSPGAQISVCSYVVVISLRQAEFTAHWQRPSSLADVVDSAKYPYGVRMSGGLLVVALRSNIVEQNSHCLWTCTSFMVH